MAHDAGHAAPAHDAHGHDAHGHDDHGGHGHHPSPMTSELSGTLGVIAAVFVALLGVFLNHAVPMGGGGHHGGGEAEAREYPTPLPGEADVIIKNAKVRQAGYAEASVIAIRQGKIIGVGGEELLGRRTATTIVHDLDGAFVYPGLRDAHGHLAALGESLNQRVCDLSADEVNGSVEDVVRAFETWMRIKKANAKPGELIEGRGWNESKWKAFATPPRNELEKGEKEGRKFENEENQGFQRGKATLPDSTELLDQIAPDNPVILHGVDGHSAWVNHKALALAGIDAKSFNPPGGRILRDKDNVGSPGTELEFAL